MNFFVKFYLFMAVFRPCIKKEGPIVSSRIPLHLRITDFYTVSVYFPKEQWKAHGCEGNRMALLILDPNEITLWFPYIRMSTHKGTDWRTLIALTLFHSLTPLSHFHHRQPLAVSFPCHPAHPKCSVITYRSFSHKV